MNPELVFNIGNLAILPAWLLMLLAPKWKYTQMLTQSYAVVLLLAVLYAVIAFTNLGAIAQADFSSLQGIKNLFLSASKSDYFMVAAWFHYLAFDLVAGTYIFQEGQKKAIPHLVLVPCLLGTFMLGPVGFLLFWIVKKIFSK